MKLLQAASTLLAVQPSNAEKPSKPSVGVCTFNPTKVVELPFDKPSSVDFRFQSSMITELRDSCDMKLGGCPFQAIKHLEHEIDWKTCSGEVVWFEDEYPVVIDKPLVIDRWNESYTNCKDITMKNLMVVTPDPFSLQFKVKIFLNIKLERK